MKLGGEHLHRIKVPMLFFAGTCDSLCYLDLLKRVFGCLGSQVELKVIEGGDRSFNAPKSPSVTMREVHEKIVARGIAWIGKHFSA